MPVPTYSFAFLDETGTLGGERDPFFAVGLLCCSSPYEIVRPLQRLRDGSSFYDEIKWTKVGPKNLPVLMDMVDVVLHSNAMFHVFLADKRQHDIIGRFGGQFKAYECLARQLVHGAMRQGETLWLIADEYSTPAHEAFEENVRDYVNHKLDRTAVAGVCRIRSTGSDLLQIIDLLLGAIVYEWKAESGVVSPASYKPKAKLLDHIKTTAGVATFVGGYRGGRFNIAVYRSKKNCA
jgi:hypothetical protein